MNKIQILKIVNAALIVSFIVQFTTVVFILARIKIPNGRMVFEVHEYNGMLMSALIVMHVTLNWGWIKANFFRVRK